MNLWPKTYIFMCRMFSVCAHWGLNSNSFHFFSFILKILFFLCLFLFFTLFVQICFHFSLCQQFNSNSVIFPNPINTLFASIILLKNDLLVIFVHAHKVYSYKCAHTSTHAYTQSVRHICNIWFSFTPGSPPKEVNTFHTKPFAAI